MVAFTIPTAARERIDQALRGCSLQSPIVNLVWASPATHADPALARAIVEGASEESIRDLVLKTASLDWQALICKLEPRVYERDETPIESLLEVQGVWFGFPPTLH